MRQQEQQQQAAAAELANAAAMLDLCIAIVVQCD